MPWRDKFKTLPPTITRDDFVGREEEINIIEKNINPDKNIRIISIHGSGGSGKTSLLREIKRRHRESHEILVLDIIDFYDITTHTLLGFTENVFNKLPDEYRNFFKDYKSKRFQIERDSYSGKKTASYEEGKILKQEVFLSFKQCFNKLTDRIRVILLIDTFEVVQYMMGDHLAQLLSGLQNTTILIAGRENNSWKDSILAHMEHSDWLTHRELGEMVYDETKALFEKIKNIRNIDEEELKKIQLLSGGRPILIIMAIDPKWPGGIPASYYDELPSMSKLSLEELEKMEPDELAREREKFKSVFE